MNRARRSGASLWHPGTTGPGSYTAVNLGTWDIRPYCRLAGDIPYSIPDGHYYAGDLLNAPHPATGGLLNGHVLLAPTTPGGVTVHLDPPAAYGDVLLPGGLARSNGDLNINYDTAPGSPTQYQTTGTSSGIALFGFKFVNGIVQINAPNCHLWWPDFTFPYTAWAAESGYPTSNYHRENGGLYHGFGAHHCRTYGMKVHSAGTGPTTQVFAHDMVYVGTQVTDINNGGNYTNVHPDCWQMLAGGNTNITFTDFDMNGSPLGFGTNIQNSPNNSITAHDDTGIVIARGWYRNCGGAGLMLNAFSSGSPRIISGSLTDLDSWNNGPAGGSPPYVSRAGYQFTQQVDGVDNGDYDINTYPHPSRIDFRTPTRCRTLFDASAVGGAVDWYTQWATAAGHGLADGLSFFNSLGWPMG